MLKTNDFLEDIESSLARLRIDDYEAKNNIPILNLKEICKGTVKNNSLVRIRAIIRDIADPELVLQGHDSYKERIPLKCTSIPGETEWSQAKYKLTYQNENLGNSSSSFPSVNSGKKRSSSCCTMDDEESMSSISTALMKKSCKNEYVDSVNNCASAEMKPKGTPFNSEDCIIHIYNKEPGTFKVNEIYEFIGLVDLSPEIDSNVEFELHADMKSAVSMERDVTEKESVSSNFTPRIHCIKTISLNNVDFVYPDSLHQFKESDTKDDQAWCLERIRRIDDSIIDLTQVRQRILDYLTQVVFNGDSLAAEYLLLCMLSKVHSRPDDGTAVGNMSVNYIDLQSLQCKEFINNFELVIRNVMPLCSLLSLTIEKLNSEDYLPLKDYENDELISGKLQLPDGSVLLINEVNLSTGKLNTKGVKNLAGLKKLIKSQQVPYDFHYYSVDFPEDVPVIIFSETKSILSPSVVVPLVSSTVTSNFPLFDMEQDILDSFRIYFAKLRSSIASLGEGISRIAEKHFVESRCNSSQINMDDLHRWLSTAKLIALSFGSNEVTEESWERMIKLEDKLAERHQSKKKP